MNLNEAIMARNLSPKCRLCRRAGEKLFLKSERCGTPKCAMIRRAYPPGMHGQKGKRSRSEYGEQLAMKQKIKKIYGILEKQLKKCFGEVKNKSGVTGDLLFQKLEMRLDNVVFRSGIASNRRQARQLVKHSHFLVNGKRANIPSLEVRVGDVVSVKSDKQKKEYFKKNARVLQEKKPGDVPGWLELDAAKKEVKVKSRPAKEDIGINVDIQMVIEYYSR